MNDRSPRRCVALFVLAAAPLWTAPSPAGPADDDRAFTPPEPTAVIPRLTRQPALEQTLNGAAWNDAVKLDRFQRIQQPQLEQRNGTAFLGYTDDHLWVAVASELPPDGELQQKHKKGARDFASIADDGVEIWIDSHPRNEDAGDASVRKHPLHWVIVNSFGDVSDATIETGSPRPNFQWSAEAAVSSRIRLIRLTRR